MRIDKSKWVEAESHYRVDSRVAWWDRRSKHWIVYDLDANGYQDGSADLYPNKDSFLTCEPQCAI